MRDPLSLAPRRRRRPAQLLVLATAACAAGCSGHGTGTPVERAVTVPARGQVDVVDQTWHCRGPVALSVLRVTMHGTSADAVHLDAGCTGTIGRIEIVGNGAGIGPGGDAVKIHRGAHDLRIGGGFIDCGRKAKRKHQDAIQAMGGRRITFVGIASTGCANSFMFVNSGKHRRSTPTAIVCTGCRARTRNYSVFVGRSISSGIRGGTFRSRVRPRATPSAVSPLLAQGAWSRRTET